MRRISVGAAVAAVLLTAGGALAQTAPGTGVGGGAKAGPPSANCPAGSNDPGCRGRSQLGGPGSPWGTGGSAGAGGSGNTWDSGQTSGSAAGSGTSGNVGRTPGKIDPRNPPNGGDDSKR